MSDPSLPAPSAFFRSASFYAFALLGWVSLTLLSLYVVLDFAISENDREFQHEAAESAMEVRQKLQASEAVLSGFAAFLQAVESSDQKATVRYASAVSAPYPHVYMLEVARELQDEDRAAFEAAMRLKWDPGFSLRDFAYQAGRRWQDVKSKPLYWPLVFMYPESKEVAPLYGLDLDSVPLLSRPVKDAWLWQAQSSSRPFRLMEGEPGYVLFQAVPRPLPQRAGDALSPFGNSLTALLVVKASALRPARLDRRDQVRAEFVVTDVGEVSDVPPLFVQEADAVHSLDKMLPAMRQEMTLTVGPQVVRISFARQLRWVDLTGFSMRAVALLSLLSLAMVMLYLRRHYLTMQVADSEHAKAQFLAMHDPLTELPNRHLLADRVRQALHRWQRSGAVFALFLIDLDHFKRINDDYGHEGGDFLLKTVAQRISNTLRATDTVARYGGDEFIVLVANVLGEADARAVGEKLLSVVSEPVQIGEAQVKLTCSLGVALCPRDGNDFESLCHQADHAMYKVKSEGRDGMYSESLGVFTSRQKSAAKVLSG